MEFLSGHELGLLSPGRTPLDLRHAIAAGIAAGVLATAFQVVCWGIFGDAVAERFLRDTRLTAAIVLGRAVLPPAAGFDAGLVLVAGSVHLALSALYGVILAVLLGGVAPRRWTGLGTLFGVLLYAVNLYGFTALYPWFSVARDPITAATHVVFGAAAAVVYKALARRARGRAPST